MQAESEYASAPPATEPRWLQVDGAAQYMGAVSRKTVYAAVAAGMRVARLADGEVRRDSKGRRCRGRMLFYTLWIDEFLQSRASGGPGRERRITFRCDDGHAHDVRCEYYHE
jgi:hypothetical protein